MWYMIRQSLFSWRLSYGSDPTLHFHTTEIVLTQESLLSRSTIQSWYSLGTAQDTAVFAAEFDMLKQYLADGTHSDTSLLEAQKRRRASDKRTMMIALGVTIFTGISILAALFEMFER